MIKKEQNKYNPKRVLILGRNGFVARNLVNALNTKSINVKALSASDLDLTMANAAETLMEEIQPDDFLVFVSALTPDKGRDRQTLLKNISMGAAVCSAIEQKQPSYVLYVGSDAVYADKEALVRESSATDPSGFHGVMHLVRERMLRDACQAKQVPLMITRPCAVYGYGDTHNSYGPNRFIKAALESGAITLGGEGEETRDHIFIDDLISVILRLIEYKSVGVANIATGKALSFFEVAKCIANSVSQSVELKFTPRQSPIIHKHFDITALLEAFPDLSLTSFEDGVKRTIENYSK